MNARFVAGAVGAVLVMTAPATARTPPNTGLPASVKTLLDCRAQTDSAARLACYDKQAGVIDQAIASRELVVIDKARANQARRSLFGFAVPNFGGLFGGGGEDDVKQIDGVVAGVSYNIDGGYILKLADGSVWSQVDGAVLGLAPRRGDKLVIKRGLMGAFYVELAKQPGFKAKRIG